MPRGIRVRVDCIQNVKLALIRNGFARQQDLAEDLELSKNTISKFFTGKSINYLNFLELCEKLSLELKDVADFSDLSEDEIQDKLNVSTTQQMVSVAVEVNGDSEEDLAEKSNIKINDSTIKSLSTSNLEKRVIGVESFPAVPVWKGRDQLIEELKAKLKQKLKVLALIGQGGIGKTSVAVKLVEAVGVDLSTRTLSTDCFYENVIIFKVLEGTSFDDGAEFLLDGLEIVTPEPLKTAEEKIGKVIQGLAQRRYLLVLDNVESILQSARDLQPGRAISPEWGNYSTL